MDIYKLLHNTQYISVNSQFFPSKTRGIFGEIYGDANISCPRCKGQKYFVAFDSTEKFMSCANKECMTKNKTAQIEVERDVAKSQENGKNSLDTYAKRIRMPQRFQQASMAKIQYDRPVMASINQWINNPKNFLFISGKPGSGKTYLTAAIINHLGSQYRHIYYLNMRTLLKKLTDAISRGHSTYEEIERIMDNHIIVLDDIGASALTEWQKEQIHFFIDSLYENEIPSIVTTNFSQHEIVINIHCRVLDRLYAAENTVIALDETEPSLRSFGK
jgi:DNA replication protein DnaC